MMTGIKKMNTPKRNGGFTLIEILVYVGILVMVASAVVVTFLSLDTVLLRNKTERVLTNSATVALERMTRDIRAASTANAVIANELTLITLSTTTVFSLSGNSLVATVNGSPLGALTSDDVTVENLEFSHYQNTGGEIETEAVRVALTLSIETKAASSTRTYYSTVVLRGTYE